MPLVMLFYLETTLIDGLILGIFTWLSFVLTYNHLPKILKNFLSNHTLFTDLIATVLAFVLLSGISQSIISVIGCITTGLLVNITLILSKK